MENNQEELLKQAEQDEYENLVEKIKHQPNLLVNCCWAFSVGGIICVIAQLISNYLLSLGMTLKNVGALTSVIMIFMGAFLTGIGVYDQIGKKAGAGSIVPITGFANAIVASAMEFKREGYIFGVGARIFSIAGPTLLFGFVASVIIGCIKYLTL